jgi:hypothetical protein
VLGPAHTLDLAHSIVGQRARLLAQQQQQLVRMLREVCCLQVLRLGQQLCRQQQQWGQQQRQRQ